MLLNSQPNTNVQIDAADLQAVIDQTPGRSLLLVDKAGRVVGVWPEPAPAAATPFDAILGNSAPPPRSLVTNRSGRHNSGNYRVTSHGQVVSSDGLGSTYHLAEICAVDEQHAQESYATFANEATQRRRGRKRT